LTETAEFYNDANSDIASKIDKRVHSGSCPEDSLRFWRSQLVNAEPLLPFPIDRPRPPVAGAASEKLTFELTNDLAERLDGVARCAAVTRRAVLLAAFQVFLMRYSDTAVIVVGVSVIAEGHSVILPLCQAVEPALTFSQLLAANEDRLKQLSEPIAFGFSSIVDEIAGHGEASHAPVFQHRFSADETASIGILDTILSVQENESTLALSFCYATALFEKESVERWTRNFTSLLEEIAADPATPIGSLSIVAPIEHAFIRECLDHMREACPTRYPSVHAMFEHQCEAAGQSIAVRHGSSEVTYAALNSRANAIARHLRKLGVERGDLVGLCTTRSIDAIAGVIGILKLGAAYVPMDLAYPPARLQVIAAEARLRWMLCDARGVGHVKGDNLVEIDLATIAADGEPIEAVQIDRETLTHVIFTSGSTGKPKGVMTRHRNVLSFMEWVWSTFTAEDLSNVLGCSSLCFDMTVFEIWAPLSVGGAIVLVENGAEIVESPQALLSLVTTVPTSVRLMAEERALPNDIRVIIACGEPLDASLVDLVLTNYPSAAFYNAYGPTEDTAFSTCYRVNYADGRDPPIGQPIVHEFALIVDRNDKPVPVGVVGELLVGGGGVAKGYIGNKVNTAQSYKDMLGYNGKKESVYRTGDFVRLCNDKQIHFIGRKDDQVKVRGFRIELNDIVTAILAIKGVSDVRVQIFPYDAGELLVAFVAHVDAITGEHHNPTIAAALEAGVAESLPAYMIPSRFVLFDKLPLNENGKVSRTALKSAAFSQADPGATQIASADELAVIAICEAVLAVPLVRKNDDFFALGGNSIQAIRLVSRLNKEFGCRLDAQMIFEDRTAKQIAKRIREVAVADLPLLRRTEAANSALIPTFAQLAMLMDPTKASFNMYGAMLIEGPIFEAELARALMALVTRHDALRAVFRGEGFDVRMEMLDQLGTILRVVDVANDEAAFAAAAAERRTPFALDAAPIRALLLRITSQRHVLVVSVHHVVTDEWSDAIIRRDLALLYQAELTGVPLALAPLSVRFADFVFWQGELHRVGAFDAGIAWWSNELASVDASQSFAPRGNETRSAMGFRTIAIPSATEGAIAAGATRHGVTPYILWLAALHLSLVGHTNNTQQVIWLANSWRSEPELEDTVGLHSNLGLIVAHAQLDKSFGEFISTVNEKIAQVRRHGAVSALTAVMLNPELLPQIPMVGFNFIDLPNKTRWRLGEAEVTTFALNVEEEADICALELTVRITGESATLEVMWNRSVFETAAIDDIIARLWSVLDVLNVDHAALVSSVVDALIVKAA
jgi:amino acid adenylation domain-containing protein